jgi:hypothetical protein
MKVRVTKNDIQKGTRRDKDQCPIGLALSRRGYDEVTVDKRAVALERKGKYVRALPLPPEAQVFITRFDNGERVEPFTFELDLG